jgi:hypothetical protein
MRRDRMDQATPRDEGVEQTTELALQEKAKASRG